uniref:Phosphatidylinositol transfer protein N-terminal domain-containing protein n=1 Tax=Aegilops tauschii subsp. strangulata TaxID=200361 RepID=A0A453IBM3_AEGTS
METTLKLHYNQAHNLNSQQLAEREVEIVDIASVSRDYWSKVITAPKVDLTTFKSQRTDRGPLLNGWMGFLPSRDDHIQACDHGCSHLGPGRTARRLPHRGGEGAVSGVPPDVLRVDRRVVRHDHGADPGDGEAHGPTPQEDTEKGCKTWEQARGQEEVPQRRNRRRGELHIVLVP